MSTILITGGTGLVGKALGQALLAKGYKVIILTREKGKLSSTPNLSYANWNVGQQTIDKASISTADHIIHLAGAGVVEKRWTKKRRQEIINSRVDSAKLIVDSLKNISNNVKTIVSASAIGWYGMDPVIPNPTPFKESDPPGNDFLGDVCRQWEASTDPVAQLGKRLVKLRIGIVVSKDGGAVKEFILPLRFGIAAILGNGKQIMSWIHIDDLVKLFITAIENENIHGVYNAVAPYPVSNKELVLQLAKSRQRFYIPFRVPSFVLKLMLGEMSIEVLKSATIGADKILNTGFIFDAPDIVTAFSLKK